MSADYEGNDFNSTGFQQMHDFFFSWLSNHYPDMLREEQQKLTTNFVDEITLYFSDYLRTRKSKI